MTSFKILITKTLVAATRSFCSAIMFESIRSTLSKSFMFFLKGRRWFTTAGWSNFCTLVGHFSKLFEFAGLNQLKTPIFVPKSGCFLKKKNNSYFRPKIRVFSKKKVFIWNWSCDRQGLCKIVPQARSWTTLYSALTFSAQFYAGHCFCYHTCNRYK